MGVGVCGRHIACVHRGVQPVASRRIGRISSGGGRVSYDPYVRCVVRRSRWPCRLCVPGRAGRAGSVRIDESTCAVRSVRTADSTRI